MPSYNPYIRIQGASFDSSAGSQLQSQAIKSLQNAFNVTGNTIEKVGSIQTKQRQNDAYKNGLNIANTGDVKKMNEYITSSGSDLTAEHTQSLINSTKQNLLFKQQQDEVTRRNRLRAADDNAKKDASQVYVKPGEFTDAFTALKQGQQDKYALTGPTEGKLNPEVRFNTNTEAGLSNAINASKMDPRDVNTYETNGLKGDALQKQIAYNTEVNNNILLAKKALASHHAAPNVLDSIKAKFAGQEQLSNEYSLAANDSTGIGETSYDVAKRVHQENPDSPLALQQWLGAQKSLKGTQVTNKKMLQKAIQQKTVLQSKMLDAGKKNGTISKSQLLQFKRDDKSYESAKKNRDAVYAGITKILYPTGAKKPQATTAISKKVDTFAAKMMHDGYPKEYILNRIKDNLNSGKSVDHWYTFGENPNSFDEKGKNLDVRVLREGYTNYNAVRPAIPGIASGSTMSNEYNASMKIADANIEELKRTQRKVNQDKVKDYSKELGSIIGNVKPISGSGVNNQGNNAPVIPGNNTKTILVNGKEIVVKTPEQPVVPKVIDNDITPANSNLRDKLKFYNDKLKDTTSTNEEKKKYTAEIVNISKEIYNENKIAEQNKSHADKIKEMTANSIKTIRTSDGIIVDSSDYNKVKKATTLLYAKPKPYTKNGKFDRDNLSIDNMLNEYNKSTKANFSGAAGKVNDFILGTTDGQDGHRQDLDPTKLSHVYGIVSKIQKKLGTANTLDTLNTMYRSAKYIDEREMIGNLIYREKYNKDSKFRHNAQVSDAEAAGISTVAMVAPVGKALSLAVKGIGEGFEKVGAKTIAKGFEKIANIKPGLTSAGQSTRTTAQNIGGKVTTGGARTSEIKSVLSRAQNKEIKGLNKEISAIDERISGGVSQDVETMLTKQKSGIESKIQNITDNPASSKKVYTNTNMTKSFRVDEKTLNQLETGTKNQVNALVKVMGAKDKNEAISIVKNRLEAIAKQNGEAVGRIVDEKAKLVGGNAIRDIYQNSKTGDAPDRSNISGSIDGKIKSINKYKQLYASKKVVSSNIDKEEKALVDIMRKLDHKILDKRNSNKDKKTYTDQRAKVIERIRKIEKIKNVEIIKKKKTSNYK